MILKSIFTWFAISMSMLATFAATATAANGVMVMELPLWLSLLVAIMVPLNSFIGLVAISRKLRGSTARSSKITIALFLALTTVGIIAFYFRAELVHALAPTPSFFVKANGSTLVFHDAVGADSYPHFKDSLGAAIAHARSSGNREITIDLDSGGGSVSYVKEMISLVERAKRDGMTVRTLVRDGNTCQSACLYLFFAGDIRSMGQDAWLMYHRTDAYEAVNASPGEMARVIARGTLGIVRLYQGVTGESPRMLKNAAPSIHRDVSEQGGLDLQWYKPSACFYYDGVCASRLTKDGPDKVSVTSERPEMSCPRPVERSLECPGASGWW